MLKRLLLVGVLACAAGVLVLGILALASGAERRGALATEDGRIVDARGKEVLMRGFNMIPVVPDLRGQTWDAKHHRQIRAAGFNTVRYVLHWSTFQPQQGRFDRVQLRALDLAVRRARDAGLHVVLDTIHIYQGEHFIPPWARDGDVVEDIDQHAHDYLRMLAERYRNERAVVGYDLVSEPPTGPPPEQNRLLRLYDSLMETIRAVDESKLLLICPSYGDSSMATADLDLIRDKTNVVFTFYDYYGGGAGDGYLPDGAQNTRSNDGAGAYTSDPTQGYPNADPGELERHLLVNLRTMRKAGIPVWIGATGINPKAENAELWARDKRALFNKYRLGYAWWLYANADPFAVLDSNDRLRPFARRYLR